MRLFIWGLVVSGSLVLAGCSNSGPNIDKQPDADIGDTTGGITGGNGGIGSGPTGTGGSAPADNPAAGVSNP